MDNRKRFYGSAYQLPTKSDDIFCHNAINNNYFNSYERNNNRNLLINNTNNNQIIQKKRTNSSGQLYSNEYPIVVNDVCKANRFVHYGENCENVNCGKILWLSKSQTNETDCDKYCNKKNILIRTNNNGLPYTPSPDQRNAFLANQRALDTAVSIVCGRPRYKSPSRYIESDVNIHYKTPIRYEPKEIIAEEELARRQAEAMRKLYEEERRQKYLKELQDINSRRHTDNFTASQKSPIALNRYDDFVCDLAPKSPNFTKTIARALFNFQGQTARELTFKKGDLITIRRQIDDNWYEGEYNAMLGLFPVSYVEVISRDYIKRLPKRPSEGQARAKFNFQAQSGIELSLNKGELVTLTRRVDKNWFEGKIANRKGIFPVTYVEVLTDIGAEDLSSTVTTTTTHTKAIVPTKQPSLETLRTSINNELNSLTNRNPSGILRETKTIQKTKVLHVDTDSEPLTYRALYKYRPQNNDELELLEGDLIYVIEKCDDGWYVGSSQRTGCFGTFPGNYVELI